MIQTNNHPANQTGQAPSAPTNYFLHVLALPTDVLPPVESWRQIQPLGLVVHVPPLIEAMHLRNTVVTNRIRAICSTNALTSSRVIPDFLSCFRGFPPFCVAGLPLAALTRCAPAASENRTGTLIVTAQIAFATGQDARFTHSLSPP